MGDFDIGSVPTNGNADPQDDGGQQSREEWVRANFTQIFGISAKDLQDQGVNPRQYATEHRDQIREFAQRQRHHGIAVPTGRPYGPTGSPYGTGGQGSSGPNSWEPRRRRYGYRGGGRFGSGMRGGSAWIGILVALLALRFLLVDSFAGPHVAVFWVLGIGGILLVARVFLFSWLRKRRFKGRQPNGPPNGQSGF